MTRFEDDEAETSSELAKIVSSFKDMAAALGTKVGEGGNATSKSMEQ